MKYEVTGNILEDGKAYKKGDVYEGEAKSKKVLALLDAKAISVPVKETIAEKVAGAAEKVVDKVKSKGK